MALFFPIRKVKEVFIYLASPTYFMSLDEQVRFVDAVDFVEHTRRGLIKKGYIISDEYGLRTKDWGERVHEPVCEPREYRKFSILLKAAGKQHGRFLGVIPYTRRAPDFHIGDLWFRTRDMWELDVYGNEYVQELTDATREVVSPFPQLKVIVILERDKPYREEPESRWSDCGGDDPCN